MPNKKLCRLRDKQIGDEPGVHTYIQACKDCHREYGPEFVVPHWSAGVAGESRPLVAPGICCSPLAEMEARAIAA
jgi:hypothetical protein